MISKKFRHLLLAAVCGVTLSACGIFDDDDDDDAPPPVVTCAEAAPEALRSCIGEINTAASAFMNDSLAAINECLVGDECDAQAVLDQQATAASEASSAIVEACGMIEELIAVDADTYIERAADQVDCTVATSHDDVAPFSPQCGPSNAEADPVRGEWTQVILDGEKWGTICGDGSEFAMHIRLAPDAGGALDNGSVGVRTLGSTMIPAWGALPYLPPYCFVGDCAVGPDNYTAFSPRLKQVPEQQYLILSNQKDNTQQGDAFFADEAEWLDAIRKAYCDTKDLPGIQFYLTSESIESTHVVSIRDEFYYGEVAGERMVDWFWRAVTQPDTVEDRAE